MSSVEHPVCVVLMQSGADEPEYVIGVYGTDIIAQGVLDALTAAAGGPAYRMEVRYVSFAIETA